MALNLSGLSNLFSQIDTHVEAKFVLDGKEYDIEHFNIKFIQDIDHKGQPQNEARGGQFSIVLTESVGDNIYDWAKRANKTKDGQVLFQSKTEGTVLNVTFQNAYCIKLSKVINSTAGTTTYLVISPEIISLNGITHNNKWRE
jgi:hypothetical protein